MRLQHLALFRGIGLGACVVNLVGECLQRAWCRTGCGVFPAIITQQLLKLPRISPFLFPTSLCGKIAFFVCELAKVRGSMMAINEAAHRPLSL